MFNHFPRYPETELHGVIGVNGLVLDMNMNRLVLDMNRLVLVMNRPVMDMIRQGL